MRKHHPDDTGFWAFLRAVGSQNGTKQIIITGDAKVIPDDYSRIG
jgi:hypothetical protein